MTSIRLDMIRENHDISQRNMATLLNVGKSTYARWETQEQFIPLSHLNDFCNIFDVSMDYTMGISNTQCDTSKIKCLNKKEIGNKIRLIRKESKLTQEELAKLLNTSHSTISAYESGKTMIMTIFALEICKKYKYSLDWLCGKTN